MRLYWWHSIFFNIFFLCCSTLFSMECSPVCPALSHAAMLGKPVSQNVVLELAMTNYFRYRCWNTLEEEISKSLCTTIDLDQVKAHALENVRPKKQSSSLYFNHNETSSCYKQEECNSSVNTLLLDITPFFFISTNAKDVTQYILPNGVSQLTIAENNTSDISAAWLQITTPNTSFSSVVKVHPQRTEAGVAFSFFTHFTAACNDETRWPERLWFSAFIPFEWVEHSLHLDEKRTSTSTTTPTPFPNATAAFNNPAWCFGKLSCKSLNKFGVADIYLRLGYDFLLNDLNHLALYGCLFIPTGTGLKSHYIFEPTIGNLGHAGLGFGLNAEWCIWQCKQHSFVSWLTDLRYAYFFSRHETRSTDIFTNGDWSRYLLVAQPSALGTPLPGINFLTQTVSITPRNTANIWTAFHIQHYDFHFEFGYNFWWRQKESASPFRAPDAVIYDIDGVSGYQTSASNATISAAEPGTDGPVSDNEPTLIIADMLSINTPIIPNMTISTFYASLGGQCTATIPTLFITAGMSYDLSHYIDGFSGFGAWLKASLAF